MAQQPWSWCLLRGHQSWASGCVICPLIQQILQSLFISCEAQDQLTTLVEGAAALMPMFADKPPELSSEL